MTEELSPVTEELSPGVELSPHPFEITIYDLKSYLSGMKKIIDSSFTSYDKRIRHSSIDDTVKDLINNFGPAYNKSYDVPVKDMDISI